MKCPVCGEPARAPACEDEPEASGLDAGELGSSRRRVSARPLAVCDRCGLGWQVAPPSESELMAAYGSLRDDTYVDEADTRRRTFARALRLLARHGAHPPGRLLDVGCSAGLFLEVAAAAGWDVRGVEPSSWLSGKARERFSDRIFRGRFEDLPRDGESFDLITMWDVLEHVASPQAFLDVARGVVGSSGLLVLNVPARDTWVARAFGRRWPLLLPEHLFYFSRASLRMLLARAGFDVLGFHPHVVSFSAGYVLKRLGQHGLSPAARAPLRLLGGVSVPLLMGEVTVVARSRRQ